MGNPSRRIVREGILEAVDVQVRDGDPPETREALRRLERDGISTEDARILIGRVLAAEMFEIVKHKREFNPRRYARALQALPRELYYDDESEEGNGPR
jgi:hypothetical protein